jgi:hypothetical protein
MNATTSQDHTASFAELLQAAISEPGKIHAAYFAFHGLHWEPAPGAHPVRRTRNRSRPLCIV